MAFPIVRWRRAAVSRVLVFWLPAGGAFGNEIEKVPDVAEIVPGRERRVGHPHDPRLLAPEQGDAWHPAAVLAVAHVLGESGALVRYHRKRPIPTFRELPLLIR